MITGRGFACKLGIFASSLPSKWVQSRAAGALGNQHGAILTGCRGPQAHVVPVFISGIGDNLWDEICKNFSDRQ